MFTYRQQAFKHLKKLGGLNLIETIDDDTFTGLTELNWLFLSFNKLKAINKK